jgi:hypothetical protein
MSEHPFDDLARTLAAMGTSRRQALRAVGGALLGALVVSPAQQVLADDNRGNSQCAHFCASVFGADTPAAGQCTSDAAHGKGLCYTCGSSTPASSICCTRNSRGFCSSYSPTLPCSCPSGQTCSNGQCVVTCATPFQPCGSNPVGVCLTNQEGTSNFCATTSFSCATAPTCTSSTACGAGSFCAMAGCPGLPTGTGNCIAFR